MKNKYERLNKIEKKDAIKNYKESSESNANIYKKFNRLRVICVIGILYSIISFVVDFYLTNNSFDFVMDGILLIFCLIIFISCNRMLGNQINNYLIKNKK